MIIFICEEHAYRSWVSHHRQGFVLDGRHPPKLGNFVLHSAVCPLIKTTEAKTTHWTSGGRLKACSLHREELENWVKEENGLELVGCPQCHPEIEATESQDGSGHVTKLGRNVLDYVFESALIHFEWPEGPPYRVNVADIANCMGKSAGQITPVLKTLLENRLISLPGIDAIDAKLPPNRLVLPTPQALKTLPAFANDSDEQLQTQLDKLLVEHS